jgi:hypothetical protein
MLILLTVLHFRGFHRRKEKSKGKEKVNEDSNAETRENRGKQRTTD